MTNIQRNAASSILQDDDGDGVGSIHGLLYAVPISLLLWAAILFWLFVPR